MHDTDYERLTRLLRLGDSQAADALLREALRRGDRPTYLGAIQLLYPEMEIDEGGVYTGDLHVAGEDLLRYAWVTRVTGALRVRAEGRVEVSALSQLEFVGGDLQVARQQGAETLELPRLRQVGGALRVESCEALRRLSCPALEQTQALEISRSEALETVEAPRLREAGRVNVQGCPALRALNLEGLEVIERDLRLSQLPALPSLSLQALREASSLELSACDALRAVELPALATLWGVSIRGLPALEALRLPALELDDEEGPAGALNLQRLNALRVIELGEGAHLSGLTLEDLPRLEVLRAPGVRFLPYGLLLARLDALRILELPGLLRSGFVTLERLPALERVSLERLTQVGPLKLRDLNPKLEALELPRLSIVTGTYDADAASDAVCVMPGLSRQNLKLAPLPRPPTTPPSDATDVPLAGLFVVAILATVLLLSMGGRSRGPSWTPPTFPTLLDPVDLDALSASLYISDSLRARTLAREGGVEGLCARLADGARSPMRVHIGDWDVARAQAQGRALPGCIQGALIIRGFDRPLRSGALSGLLAVEGDLRIHDNPGLTSLQLPNLAVIGGALRVYDNPVLRGLPPFLSLRFADAVEIHDNPALSRCLSALSLRLQEPERPVELVRNAPSGDCTSAEER